MNHAQDTIDHIRLLLRNAGLPEGDTQEEMLDHYLSEIESLAAQNGDVEAAHLLTFERIQSIDFSNFKKERIWSPYLLLSFLIIALFSIPILLKEPIPEVMPPLLETEAVVPEGWPLQGDVIPIASNFGMRMHPVFKQLKLHQGIDIRARIGTPVVATGNAVVRETGFSKNTGNYIVLEHNHRYSTRYYHLSEISIHPAEIVSKGTIIGKVGNTGLSTAPHLHYEIIDEGDHVDPMECIRP